MRNVRNKMSLNIVQYIGNVFPWKSKIVNIQESYLNYVGNDV